MSISALSLLVWAWVAPVFAAEDACRPGLDVVVVLDDSLSLQRADPANDRRELVDRVYSTLGNDILDPDTSKDTIHRLGVIHFGANADLPHPS